MQIIQELLFTFRQLLWCITVATKYCLYKFEQLIGKSKAKKVPELQPQIQGVKNEDSWT